MKGKVAAVLMLCAAGLLARDIRVDNLDIPFKGEEELDVVIEFGLGNLELSRGTISDYLMKSIIEYDADIVKPVIDYKVLGNRGRLKMYTENFDETPFKGWKKRDRELSGDLRKNHWTLEFNRSVPTSFDIELGLGKGRLDFTDLKISDLSLECGLSDVVVEFRKRNDERIRNLSLEAGLGNVELFGLGFANIERFDVECGLGSTRLNFEGDITQNMKGRISVGLGSVAVEIPDNVGVEIEAESSFLSSLNLKDFDEIDEDVYRSENWRKTKYKIYMVIEIGLGSVDIDWVK